MPDHRRFVETSEEWELFLLGLRYRGSRLVTLSGNEPFLLSGEDNAWLVYKGVVDVFAVRTEDGEIAGARHHFFRAHTHQLLLGIPEDDRPVALLASCAPETQILQFSRSRLIQQLKKPENGPIVAGMLENWVRSLASGVASAVRPKEYQVIEPDQELTLDAGQNVRSQRGVVWVQLEGGAWFLGREDVPPISGEAPMPIAERSWVQTAEPGGMRAFDTLTMLQQDAEWSFLTHFGDVVLSLVEQDIQRDSATATRLIQDKMASDELKVQTAFSRLASTWSEEPPALLSVDSPDPLVAACRLVGRSLGVTIKTPPNYDGLSERQDPLAEIVRASHLRIRMVLLRDDWWQRDNGPVLAFRGEDRDPVALLPVNAQSYTMHDPAQLETLPVDDVVASELTGTAYAFYRPFPERPLSALDLLRFGIRGTGRDLLTLLVVSVAGGLLALLVPIVTGVVFDQLIPSGEQTQLLVLGGVLAVSALAIALFQIARGIVLLRIEGRMDSSIQAAVWDRLLSLPADFFRRYSAGELTERAMGVYYIKQTLSGSVILSMLSGVFSFFNLLVMFYYDVRLTLITIGIMLVAVAATVGLALQLLRYQREVTRRQGEISGLIAQLVGGMSKLRVAGAEGRAFFLWANAFSTQKKLAFKARSVLNYLNVLIVAFPVLASMVLFAVVYGQTGLSTGMFLAFNAAFVQFILAGMQFSGACVAALSVVPVYERLKPIVQMLPEVDEQKADPGELSGAIEVNHVSFRYDKEGPLVLDDVTFNVEPGEFVALVGASGSGKSTLLRHLLGFERPDSGAVYYDGQALSEIDLRAVRRQIGVVLQHSQVVTGTILENIVGSSGLTADDAWSAARQAGIEADIKQMPMGMQTYISEGGSTFSGGQRQRLLIARALVTRPRIIFFDEATSALDDRSQSQVTESLKQVDATRIVIAHRLSTIVDANRILVMQRGKIVEQGTYTDLLARGGVFSDLAQRQLI